MKSTEKRALIQGQFNELLKVKIAEPKEGEDEDPGELASGNWLGLRKLAPSV